MKLRPKRVLLKPHVRSDRIYFPGNGAHSFTHVTADGQIAGVALIGNEGLIGLTEFGGDPDSGITAEVEIADADAHVMDVDVFHAEMDRRPAFYDLVRLYTRAFAANLMQSVVCNALHPVERRCARWLLELRDRAGRNELDLTQDALAGMLGIRRASVTLCAGHLHSLGLVEKHQGRIVIRDPAGLESAACECYRVIKGHFARLLP